MAADLGDTYSIGELCLAHNVSRQAYYQHLQAEAIVRYEEEIILQWVLEVRRRQPRIGGRKLLFMIEPKLEKAGFKLGRDGFFDLLRKNNMLIKRRKKYHYTTNSNHPFKRYQNLIADLKVVRRDQVFVADITYIDTNDGFLYLALLTDAASRKIVGFDDSDSLAVEGSLRALNASLADVTDTSSLIHHSDRGVQYCCYAYTGLLQSKKVRISMAEKGNPYENAMAERVNGILKLEFLLDQIYPSKAVAREAVHEAIHIYNYERPHGAINMLTPVQMYEQFC